MSKFRSRTLYWKEVESEQVVGYKVYWSKGKSVSYESESAYVGDLTEIVIPNALENFVREQGDYMFGITAVDQWGNESDIKTLKEPIHFSAPSGPESIWVEPAAAPSPPESLWVEITDMALAIDKNSQPAIGPQLMDEFFEDESCDSQQAAESEQKDANNRAPETFEDIGF
ncbi:hypothetical protein [Desulfatitalea tepidiphila]|uniref:hypothetical protein n=1 Tax=Desulfatitalea tepidiphila TaxID=1185843 RepID=UPI0006B57228|nr:hypothetical protein [Desulfatitalea tepidiphila]